MLKRLRIKFIVINMTIVTMMLCFIFGALYTSTRHNLETESLQRMRSLAMSPLHPAPPDLREREVRLPYFSILVNPAGEMVEVGGGYFDLSDRALLEQILAQTKDLTTDQGLLKDYNLRFLRTDTPRGQCIVFADISNEQGILGNLIKNLMLTGALAFVLFLGISILLAEWAVKPVERAWRQQKQFVADASHELKTPLTIMTANAELLQLPDCSCEERNQLVDSLMTTVRQMRGLVEGLLELARIDSGRVQGDPAAGGA